MNKSFYAFLAQNHANFATLHQYLLVYHAFPGIFFLVLYVKMIALKVIIKMDLYATHVQINALVVVHYWYVYHVNKVIACLLTGSAE